ncbi:replication protein RepA, partial [Streptococcus suis]
LINLWIDGKEETRSAAANYEIGENGVHHSHLILEAKNQTRFSAIKKLYPAIHIELTRGSREQVTAYLNKTGKHEEKNQTTV